MKILLVAINAKYIHTNPAVYLLRANAGRFRNDIKIREFTINQSLDDILMEIVEEKPAFIGFSSYIWNIDMVKQLIRECRKLLPDVLIWLGGPEAEAGAEHILREYPQADGVMYGEGENTLPKVLGYFLEIHPLKKSGTTAKFRELQDIPGIMFRTEDKIVKTAPAKPVNLDKLVFPYDDAVLEQLNGKILYYESSRGCPFHCSYCLSSEDNQVRFRSVDKVKEDLKVFLDARLPQVKFVDRTFNCNHTRMIALLQFMLEHDNGITNFHFEIGGDLLTEEELDLLSRFRPGAVQLEIGVQTTNPEVMERIGRVNKKEALFANVRKLLQSGKQHVHLDLIAGLPGEDLQSFIKSFDEVYSLHPHQLQLGFLKVLGNTRVSRETKTYGIKYREYPPYEVLETASISYREFSELKQVEAMVEMYYNSGQFTEELRFAENYLKRLKAEKQSVQPDGVPSGEMQDISSGYRFYRNLAGLYFSRFNNGMQSSRMAKYEVLIAYIKSIAKEELHDVVVQLAVYDCYARERKKARPSFSLHNDGERIVRSMLHEQERSVKYSPENHAEHFTIDIKKTAETGTAAFRENIAIFDYGNRSPITQNAAVMVYDL